MSEIAKNSGVSRQALYLHFASRAELLIATTHYVDDIKGLERQLDRVRQCQSGLEMLKAFIEVWGNYIPEIYSVSKALIVSKENDEASATAWKEIMGCLHKICDKIVKTLFKENKLSSHWTQQHASDFLYTLVSISNWEQLTLECQWSNKQFVSHIDHTAMKALLSEK